MLKIISISLPNETVKFIKQEIKKGKYASVSEFFRAILRDYEKESKLLADVKESKREIKQGKGKVLKSFKDLR